jgi:hypothetical protein
VILAQVGGRILDTRGAKPAVVGGCVISAVGFYLLAGKLTDLSLGAQWFYVALAGGGVGLMLGTASTDAVNRAPSPSYTEVTGITQTAPTSAPASVSPSWARSWSARTRPTSRTR